MVIYNLMTGNNFSSGFSLPFSLCWLALFVTFMAVIILRRQCDDGIMEGTPFNFFGAMILGIILAVVLATLTGDPRWTILAGVVGIGVGGFGLGYLTE